MVKALIDMYRIDPNIPDLDRYQIKEYPMTKKQMRGNTPAEVMYYGPGLRGSLSYMRKLWAKQVAKRKAQEKLQPQVQKKAGQSDENNIG